MKQRADGMSEHRLAWDAIPWIANASASEPQRQWVATHVRGCDECRAELARQRELQAALVKERPAATDVDAGLQRLWKRIDQAKGDSDQVAAVSTRPHRPQRMGRWGGSALVCGLTFAVVVEAIGISVLGVGLLSRAGPPPSYQSLSDAAVRSDGATIRMIPAAAMSMGELQSLLVSLELQVVAGPNTVGAYALAPLSAQASRDRQLARLRAVPGMRLVEPILEREPAR